MPKKRKLQPDERFVQVTDEELNKKRKELKNENTEKADKKAEKCFLEYLSLSNLDDLDYWDFEESLLDEILCKFWFEVRTVDSERYRVSSLRNMRYALNRCIQKREKNFDIIKSPAFVKSQRAFNDAVKELKALGLGYVKSYPEIAPKDLLKLYHSPELDPDGTPQTLQNKVQFDIRYYFCRRGVENLHDFTKDTFSLQFDVESRITYLKKVVDEQTKNHKETDAEIVPGFMPQMLDVDGRPHRLCPIQSYEIYIGHLHPDINALWQQPLKRKPVKEENIIWFKRENLGHNPLDSFMGRLSDRIGLSMHYTNHCVRVTGATNLSRKHYTPKQIMSVTGHKSINSLAIYQRVKEDEKLMMGMSLTYCLLNPEEVHRILLAASAKQHNQQNMALQNVPNPPQPLPTMQQALPVPQQQIEIPQVAPPAAFAPQIQPHALDPNTPQVLPLESALVPYNPNENPNQKENQVPTAGEYDFDLAELVAEFQEDTENETNMLLAATQMEKNPASTKVQTTTMIWKNSPRMGTTPTFQNCKIGHIGAINIHIHKH